MIRQGSESGFHFLQDWLRCRRYWWWKYRKGLEPKERAPALDFGTAVHEALASWYQRLPNTFRERTDAMIETFRTSMTELKEGYSEHWQEDFVRGQMLLQEYAVKHMVEPWKVHCVEQDMEYVFPETGDKFTARMDAVVEDADARVYIMDHKTTGWAIAKLRKSLMVSDQGTGYIWLWNKIKPTPVHGIIFNVLRSTWKGDNDFDQVIVIKTIDDLKEFEAKAQFLLNEIAGAVSDPNYVFMKNDQACMLYNRLCPYYDLCLGSSFAHELIDTQFVKTERHSGDEIYNSNY